MTMIGIAGVLLVLVILLAVRDDRRRKQIRELTDYLEEYLTYPDREYRETLKEGELANLHNNISSLCKRWKFEQNRHKKDMQEMNHFTENLAHQLRNAMTSLQLRMDELELTVERPEERELCGKCQQSMDRISEEVQRLLNSSLLAAGKVRMEYEKLPLEQMLRQISRNLDPMCERKQVSLDVEMKVQDDFQGDSFWLGQALENLVKNAVEHTGENSTVQVLAEQKEECLEISICDEGEGILPDQLERLFERYYRGNRNKSGYGIGLSMARDIVLAHHGKLTVKNLPKGGACFSIFLPRFN